MEDEMTYDEKTLSLVGLLAEAKVRAKEVFDLELEILAALVEHAAGENDETVH